MLNLPLAFSSFALLAHIAGFEWGTGFYINSVIPEEAAKSLCQFIRDKS
jgi:galactose-1-phosphate uridylyltransferase